LPGKGGLDPRRIEKEDLGENNDVNPSFTESQWDAIAEFFVHRLSGGRQDDQWPMTNAQEPIPSA
jgi:hypothetical protein